MATALITDAEADAYAPIWLSDTDSALWLALTSADKTRHILQASVYLLGNIQCKGTWDVTAPPEAIKEAVALLAFLSREQDLFFATASVAGGELTETTDVAGPLRTTRKYSSGATSTSGDRFGRVKDLLAKVLFSDGTEGSCTLGTGIDVGYLNKV